MSGKTDPNVALADGGIIRVSGSINVDSVARYRESGVRLMEEVDEVVFDLSDTDVHGSAAIALLIAWQRAAQVEEKSLRFRNPPENLRSIAEACGVENIIPFA